MKNLPKPSNLAQTILVTHRGCMDGAACALMFVAAGGQRKNIRYITAGSLDRYVKKISGDDADKFHIFADVGLSKPEHADALESRGNCVLIDHHETSRHLEGKSWCHIDAVNGGTGCGSILLLRYLSSLSNELFMKFSAEFSELGFNPYKRFCEIVDDHDRWQLKIPESEKFAVLMTFVGQERFIDMMCDIDWRFDSEGFVFYQFEDELIKILEEKRAEIVERLVEKTFVENVDAGGKSYLVGYVVTSDGNTSHILNEILEKNKDVDIACQISPEKMSVSLRSRDGVDCAEFAKVFGGGGHKKAAGHPLHPEVWKSLAREIHSG